MCCISMTLESLWSHCIVLFLNDLFWCRKLKLCIQGLKAKLSMQETPSHFKQRLDNTEKEHSNEEEEMCRPSAHDQLQFCSSSYQSAGSQSALAQRDDLIESLKKQLDNATKESEEKDRVVDQMKVSMEEQLKSHKSELQSTITANEENMAEKASTIESLRQVLRDTEEKCQENVSQLFQLNAELDQTSVKMAVLKKQLQEVDAWKDETSSRNNKLELELQSVTMERNDANYRAEGQKREVEILQKELINAHSKLEQMEKKCKEEAHNIRTMEDRHIMEKMTNAELRKKICVLQGNIRVICRVRPLSDPNQYAKLKYIEDEKIMVDMYEFEFDKVFAPDSSQEMVFEEIEDAVLTCMNGHRVSILAYGQTSR